MTPEEYIKQRVNDQYNYFDKKATEMQKKFKVFSVINIILSALIPVLTFLADSAPFIINLIISSFGAAVSIFTGILYLGKYQQLWYKYRLTAENLKTVEYQYRTRTGEYSDNSTAFNLLVTNTEKILSNTQTDWENIVNIKQT